MSEKFNPSAPEYKKVEDLPKGEKGNFRSVEGGGFVRGTAKNIGDLSRAEIDREKELAPRAFQFEFINDGDVSEGGKIEMRVDSKGKFIPESIKILDCPPGLTDIAMKIVQEYVEAKNKGVSSYDYQLSEDGAPRYEEVTVREVWRE